MVRQVRGPAGGTSVVSVIPSFVITANREGDQWASGFATARQWPCSRSGIDTVPGCPRFPVSSDSPERCASPAGAHDKPAPVGCSALLAGPILRSRVRLGDSRHQLFMKRWFQFEQPVG